MTTPDHSDQHTVGGFDTGGRVVVLALFAVGGGAAGALLRR